ncbi:MAG: ATP-binding cassette domain-containing protein [Rhodospirillaceae bacterium]|nr:ATP-binding cassette domain-containing protein [Rhodospirillaceae bacterium]
MTAPTILPLSIERLFYAVAGRALLESVSVEIAAGSRTVILGPNGAGKSLCLRLAQGLIAPTAGCVVWKGPGAAQAKMRQAMVFQRPVLLRRSAAANVSYALAVRGVPRADRPSRVEEALARAGLAGLGDRPARTMSGGEQQKLALARAWALKPEVLFLDEPTASLDPAAVRAVEAMIQAIHEGGTKIVMTTHDLGQAKRLADEVLFLHNGRLVERAPADRFFEHPSTLQAAAFLRGEILA